MSRSFCLALLAAGILAGMSYYSNILQNVLAAVQGIAPTWNDVPIPVSIRKLPKKEEGLDTCPLIAIAPSEAPEEVEVAAGEGYVYTWRTVEIVLITAGDGDFTSNLGAELNIRQALTVLFQKPTPFGSNDPVFDTDVRLLAPLDRKELNESYDYSGLTPRFCTCEPRDSLEPV